MRNSRHQILSIILLCQLLLVQVQAQANNTITDNTVCDSDHVCYHGGKCLSGSTDDLGNPLQFHCDCTDAVGAAGQRFAGKYCEHAEVEVCDFVKHIFCVNDGVCKENPLETETPCSCGASFAGANCEYSYQDIPPCHLDCQHGGSCQVGIPSWTPAEQANFWNTQHNANFTYCLCPTQYQGTLCEIESLPCGDQTCFHGSTCVEPSDQSGDYFCDCTAPNTLSTSLSYAGRNCEYEATMNCTDNQNGLAFCVNQGSCVDGGNG
jgi:hypothetical protein